MFDVVPFLLFISIIIEKFLDKFSVSVLYFRESAHQIVGIGCIVPVGLHYPRQMGHRGSGPL